MPCKKKTAPACGTADPKPAPACGTADPKPKKK